jgi:hypothetical protein
MKGRDLSSRKVENWLMGKSEQHLKASAVPKHVSFIYTTCILECGKP